MDPDRSGNIFVDISLTHVMYGSAGFFAGADEEALVSADGLTWERITIPDSFYAGAAGESGYVAFGEDDIWTSPDGREWASATRLPDSVDDLLFTAVVEFAGGFAAVGVDRGNDPGAMASVLWISEDGDTWNSVDTRDLVAEDSTTYIVGAVAVGPGLILVGATTPDLNHFEGRAWLWSPEDVTEPLGFGAYAARAPDCAEDA